MSRKISPHFFLDIAVEKPSNMRYVTVGDWFMLGDSLSVDVANTGNPDYNFLIGFHEMIELYLCHKWGISEDKVNKYDMNHTHCDDPGSHEDAPYHEAHEIANEMEKNMSVFLEVVWPDYIKRQDEVAEKIRKSLKRRGKI